VNNDCLGTLLGWSEPVHPNGQRILCSFSRSHDFHVHDLFWNSIAAAAFLPVKTSQGSGISFGRLYLGISFDALEQDSHLMIYACHLFP
jgi:hypothetical protein